MSNKLSFMNGKVHSHDTDNTTPLVLACKNGFSKCATLFIAKGANVNSRTKQMLTSLHEAARGNHVKCATLLLEKSASLKVLGIHIKILDRFI